MEDHQKSDVHKTIADLHKMRKKDRVLIFVLVIVTGLLISAGTLTFVFFNKEFLEIKTTQKSQYFEHLTTNQFLLSTIDWSTQRTKKILYMRDKIAEEWKRIQHKVQLGEAYDVAETNMRACEGYSYLDPFFVLAMQNVESSFRHDVRSKMGAMGLNQIMPSTGRLLCSSFGWSYSDSMLYDVEASTRMAVRLLDVLYSQYGNWEQTLADYNGGPWQAHYYKTNRGSLAKETLEYVPKVMEKFKEYSAGFKDYRVDTKLTSKIR